MKLEVKKWLIDITQVIDEIEIFMPKSRSFFDFQSDLKTKRAIERCLEIIGEAVNRIHKESPNFRISETRRIIATRNRIIHGYDSVSDEIIWTIIIKEIPKLKNEIEILLKEKKE